VTIILPEEYQHDLIVALRKAEAREIGGIIMGEKISQGVFRVADLTVQSHGGAFTSFIRKVTEAVSAMQRFFSQTSHDYKRFNYLGEWHSHPKYPLFPSQKDINTMFEILYDLEVGANFVVLLLVKLIGDENLDATASVFYQNNLVECQLILENVNEKKEQS